MGKILFWIFLVFAVLLGLRLLNVAKRKARDQAQAASRRTAAPADEAMVRCQRCGTFVPRTDALPAPDGGFTCGDPGCASRR